MVQSRLSTQLINDTSGRRSIDAPAVRCAVRRPAGRGRRAFSLIELAVVLGVTVMLASLLFPALGGIRETANRMTCASNQRQIGLALTMWGSDHQNDLPRSHFCLPEVSMPQEMMAASIGETPGDWDGLGHLVATGYIDNAACLYCPSHSGDHGYCQYKDHFAWPGTTRIYINYHYAGDRDLFSNLRRRMDNDHEQILLTDGLRTLSDFNHGAGANLLHGDGAVVWFEDTSGQVRESLPSTVVDGAQQYTIYNAVWQILYKKD